MLLAADGTTTLADFRKARDNFNAAVTALQDATTGDNAATNTAYLKTLIAAAPRSTLRR